MGLLNKNLKGEKLEILHKELDLIQSVITRMAQNSFYMKGWCITLIAAIFSLSDGTAREHVYLPLAFMVVAFWGLDSYYLRRERAYRELYKDVVKRRTEVDDWGNLYCLDCKGMLKRVQSFLGTMFSPSEWPLYLILSVALMAFGRNDFYQIYEMCKSSSVAKWVVCQVTCSSGVSQKNSVDGDAVGLNSQCPSSVLPACPTNQQSAWCLQNGTRPRERPSLCVDTVRGGF